MKKRTGRRRPRSPPNRESACESGQSRFRVARADHMGGLVATHVALAPAAGTYVNPVLDEDFPDPAVIHADDGHYYAYATQTLRDGQWINIQVARSPDLVHWELLGDALPEKPDWARETQDFWAPFVLWDGQRYLMYYSATHDVVPRSRTRPLPCRRHVGFAGRALHRHGHAAAARRRLRIYRPDGVRRPGKRQILPLLGIRIPADQGAGTWRPTICPSRRQLAGRPRLAQPHEGRIPAAGRSRLGDPPR